tara:strand:- start:833 stop:2305 length:1473 start_codon:yes stop_codon:yes gene_type:complete
MAIPQTNNLQRAGNFSIESAIIITSKGIKLNVLPQILHLEMGESIQLNSISGNLFLSDTIDIASIGPIIGQEYLSLKIQTTGVNNASLAIDFTQELFHITSLTVRAPTGQPNTQALLLEFTTHELVKNQRVKLNKSFTGTCSDIVETILRNELKTKKNLFIEPSDGIKKFVFPNVDPFTAINMIKREAVTISDGAPTFMFYEDLRGYHFRSLSSMYEKEVSQKYNPSVIGSKGGVRSEDAFNDMRSVLGTQITGNGDTLLGSFTGAYASKLTVYDTYARRFKEYTYNYLDSFKTEQHISSRNKITGGSGEDDFPLISETPVENTSRISDFPAKTFLRSTANKIVDESDPGISIQHTNDGRYTFNSTRPETWLQRRQSQIVQLENGISAKIEVHGNIMVQCGSIIQFNLPLASWVEIKGNEDRIDKFFRGRFLVKAIRHDFSVETNRHEMVLDIIKDSLPSSLSKLDKAIDTQPEQAGTVQREFGSRTGTA